MPFALKELEESIDFDKIIAGNEFVQSMGDSQLHIKVLLESNPDTKLCTARIVVKTIDTSGFNKDMIQLVDVIDFNEYLKATGLHKEINEAANDILWLKTPFEYGYKQNQWHDMFSNKKVQLANLIKKHCSGVKKPKAKSKDILKEIEEEVDAPGIKKKAKKPPIKKIHFALMANSFELTDLLGGSEQVNINMVKLGDIVDNMLGYASFKGTFEDRLYLDIIYAEDSGCKMMRYTKSKFGNITEGHEFDLPTGENWSDITSDGDFFYKGKSYQYYKGGEWKFPGGDSVFIDDEMDEKCPKPSMPDSDWKDVWNKLLQTSIQG